MTVDDGFSVLEAGRAEMGTKHSSKAIEVVRVLSLIQIYAPTRIGMIAYADFSLNK